MIFLDTSAIYALADRGDPNHREAKELFAAILARPETLITHNYVIVESLALIQHRLGMEAARLLAEEIDAFEIEWIGEAIHREARARWSRSRRRISFVDQVSFVVMTRRNVSTAFAFDDDFEKAGFRRFNS